ncbi:MAG: UDP-N-acetylglucosamine diphosphorylase/glucosamine-1-phosphate N-acetyltransferase [Rhodospirillaceae bacterium]|nr:UDP-N-acetylglucosamine diphosphorylase/glucosamine-1-phosphate N-acetyltransferase [Rhodospirillaceae bacterium]
MSQQTAAIILAAGQGTRMRSSLPKVLHPVCELPLIVHVVRLALASGAAPVVVVIDPAGKRTRDLLSATFPGAPLVFAIQEVPRGTGDAARAGLEAIPDFKGQVLVLAGDVPLLQKSTISKLQKAGAKLAATVLTTVVEDPTGYGRIVREGKKLVRIVEHKDASKAEKEICEINSGVYLFHTALLRPAVLALRSDNAQGEFYLTDVVEEGAKQDQAAAVIAADPSECSGVNNREQLAAVEAVMRQRLIRQWQHKGVSFLDPQSTMLGADVKLAQDVTIGASVQIWGDTKISKGVVIHGPTFIKNSQVGAGTVLHSFSHLEQAKVGKGAQIGPYARLRPDASLADEVKVGNFVEVKKSQIGKGAKLNHLSYVGDATIGAGSNVGAGTITCNYDGHNKHQTVLGRGVFIGSNSTLVAPLELGDGAYIAAGSTITKQVPADALAFGRSKQVNREDYATLLKNRNEQAKAQRLKEKE